MVNIFVWLMMGSFPFLLFMSNSILFFWVFLEVTTIMFISSMQTDGSSTRKEPLMIYFISQSIASAVFLVASFGLSFCSKTFMLDSSQMASVIICLSLSLKLAMAPLHQWVILMGKALPWKVLLVMLSWQKLIPILIMMSTSMGLLLILLSSISLVVGTLTMVKISSLKLILIFSSISHLGWMMICIPFTSLISPSYLFIYTLIFTGVMLKLQSTALNSLSHSLSSKEGMEVLVSMLSLAGIPPFLGFILKWISLEVLLVSPFLSLLYTLMACVSFFVYMSMLFKAFLSQGTNMESQKTYISYKLIWTPNLVLPILLFSF